MATRKSRRSARKPKDLPKESSVDSHTDVQLLIQRHIIEFMGRRFPEFCIIRAACRVSVKASTSATGDKRVASYQAAINAVAAQYYADRPFMVEVLNKWLEMNQDFVRDPVGYVAPTPPPDPTPATTDGHSPTISTIQDTPSQTTTSVTLTSPHRLTHGPPMAADSIPPLSSIASSSSVTSTVQAETDDPPSSLEGGHDAPVPTQKTLPVSWIGALRFLRCLGVDPLTFGNAYSAFRSWFDASGPSTQRTLGSPNTRWSRLGFLAAFYKGWWGALKKAFGFTSG